MSDRSCSGMQSVLYTLRARVLNAVKRSDAFGSRLVRMSVCASGIPVLTWLKSRPDLTRLYWSGRDDDEHVVGLSVADRWHSVRGCVPPSTELAAKLRSADPGIRYYGGVAFDPSGPQEHPWDAFGTCQFVLPRFEIRASGCESRLFCNLVLPEDAEEPESLARQFDWPTSLPMPVNNGMPVGIERSDDPDEAQWEAMVGRALRAFRQPALNKVVYARRAKFRANDYMDPTDLLGNLILYGGDSFQFFFQVADQPAFVCNSPERLFRRRNGEIESEAVAGTMPRSGSAEEDARRAQHLMDCSKERREHEFVRVGLREQLAPHLATLSLDPSPTVMCLASSLHLRSKLHATIRKGVTSLDVLEGLHPTPAVGGYPTAPALAEIRAEEPFDRGWYAGPVGWIGCDAAEFAVGIRSGLVREKDLTVYAGAGIVRGSTAKREWLEIEHKIGAFLRMVGFRGDRHATVSAR